MPPRRWLRVPNVLLDPDLPASELREWVYAVVGRVMRSPTLSARLPVLVRSSDDVFYTELEPRKATVSRFLPTLLRVTRFDANPGGIGLTPVPWTVFELDFQPQTDAGLPLT